MNGSVILLFFPSVINPSFDRDTLEFDVSVLTSPNFSSNIAKQLDIGVNTSTELIVSQNVTPIIEFPLVER